jgi:hypothetical protein
MEYLQIFSYSAARTSRILITRSKLWCCWISISLPSNQTSAHGQRGPVRNIDEMWRICHEFLASTQVILTSLASPLNYCNYVSYLLQNPPPSPQNSYPRLRYILPTVVNNDNLSFHVYLWIWSISPRNYPVFTSAAQSVKITLLKSDELDCININASSWKTVVEWFALSFMTSASPKGGDWNISTQFHFQQSKAYLITLLNWKIVFR